MIRLGVCIAVLPCPAAPALGQPQVPRAVADRPLPTELDPRIVGRIKPSGSAYFGPLSPAARQLLQSESTVKGRQHFCAIGYVDAEGIPSVWVHWREAQRLILWRGDADPAHRSDGLRLPQSTVRLGVDTVESTSDLQGSIDKVTVAWWQAVVRDCAAHGEKAVVRAAPAAPADREGSTRTGVAPTVPRPDRAEINAET